MDISITARHFEISDALRQLVDTRLSRLDRFNPRLSTVEVTLTEEKREKRVEAHAGIDGDLDIHAEAVAEDFRAAVNKVSDKLERQLKRQHELRRDHKAPSLNDEILLKESVEDNDS